VDRKSLKILLIEDTAADAELIQELLAKLGNTQFELTLVHCLEDGLKCLRQEEFDILLLDLSLPETAGLDTVFRVKAQAPNVPIVVLTTLKDKKIAIEAVREGAQDYLVKGHLEDEVLVQTLRYAIERQRDHEAIQQQAQRERLLVRMLENIRQSLDLKEILQATVAEVRQFLRTDRVLIHRYPSKKPSTAAVEAVDCCDRFSCNPDDYTALAPSRLLLSDIQYTQVVEDIETVQLEPKYRDLLTASQVRAVLTVPIWQCEQTTPNLATSLARNDGVARRSLDSQRRETPNRLWGLLTAHHCSSSRSWQQWEIDFLNHLATQVAIAIQQSELYQQLEFANQQLEQLATHDSLTGLANRRHFDKVLDDELRRLAREFKPLSLLLCDIDFFKLYNDTYTHQVGDACLQQVAKAIAQAARRPADLVARYGGEEFAVILPNTDSAGALVVAQSIRRQLETLQLPHATSPIARCVTVSIGIVTTTPRRRQPPTNLVRAADVALYRAKALGRNRIFQGDYNHS
jgi:two-component system, cell cycle response regulator